MKLTQAQERALVALLDRGADRHGRARFAHELRNRGVSGSALAALDRKDLVISGQDWESWPLYYWLSRRGLAEAKRLKGEG